MASWVEVCGMVNLVFAAEKEIEEQVIPPSYLAPEVVLEAFRFKDGSRDPLLIPSSSARTEEQNNSIKLAKWIMNLQELVTKC